LVYYAAVIVNIHLIFRWEEVFTMTKGGTKKMKIKAKKDTGEIEKIMHDTPNEEEGEEVTQEELNQIYESGGFRYVGLILHAHSSPG